MADVIDVIQRLTFDVEGDAEIKKAANEIQNTLAKISALTGQLNKYEQKLRSTSRLEISERKAIQTQIDRVKNAIVQQTAALEGQIVANKKIQQEVSREIGLIGQLQKQMDVLKQKRDIATDPAKIRQFNKELADSQTRMSALTGTGGSGVLSGVGAAILQGVGIGTGIGLVTEGIGAIKAFIGESSKLAAEAEGVERAFARLNKPDLLEELQKATKGTVSDLQLMKSAISFSNFGLPVDKLATALEFARRRAADTGNSVDYLVESITTGIGRQSPLILDNLGINAKRVAEEFKRTGNFAEAAFKIIQEESAKAGADLETFAEKQARMNANIQNAQVGFGKLFNEMQGFLFSVGQDFIGAFTDSKFFDKETYSSLYVEAQKAAREGQQELKRIQVNGDALYLQSFKDFSDSYKDADYSTREKIKDQADEMYSSLLIKGKTSFEKDLEQQKFYLDGLRLAYQKFTASTQQPINLNKITVADISGFSKEELEGLKEKVDNARTSLTANDTAQIARLNKLADAIAKYSGIISGDAAKKAQDEQKKKADELAKVYEELRKTILDISAEMRTIEMGEFESAAKDLEAAATVYSKVIKILQDRAGNQTGVVQDGTFPSGRFNSVELEAGAAQGRANAEILKKKKEHDKKVKEKEEEALKEYGNYALQTTASTLQSIYDMQLYYLDKEIQARQERVDQAVLLAEKGNTEILESERNGLIEAQNEREKIATRQLQINALLQASSAAIAATQAIQVVTNAGATGDPYTTAARIAAAVAALAAGFAFVTNLTQAFKFKDGVIDLNGPGNETSDSIPARLSRGESVMTAKETKAYKPFLEAMRNGSFDKMLVTHAGVNATGKNDYKSLEKRLDKVVDAVENIHISAKQSMDRHGLTQVLESHRKQEADRWR